MKAIINMGKIDYLNRGRKECLVEIELSVKDENKPVLTICTDV